MLKEFYVVCFSDILCSFIDFVALFLVHSVVKVEINRFKLENTQESALDDHKNSEQLSPIMRPSRITKTTTGV